MRPFISSKNTFPPRVFAGKEKFHQNRRRSGQLKWNRSAKLRTAVGIIQSKRHLRSSLLNIDGLSEVSLEDVKSTISQKKPDIVILLETKRREEECEIDIAVPGYSVHEALRSNVAGDKEGGGIAVYTKLGDGLLFKRHTPDITDPANTFVNNERVWVTVQSNSSKTAVCGLYLGCQYGDDRHGRWNDTIYQVVQQEAFALRSKGYRVVYLGDFNGHVGCRPGQGIVGNNPDVNLNGSRFLDFLTRTDSRNVNSVQRLTTGLWTRQRGGHSSIIDYAVVSNEHMDSVISLHIDDKGEFGGGSDHNWLILDLRDHFVKKKRIFNGPTRKDSWNITPDQDWSGFRNNVLQSIPTLDTRTSDSLASSISASILSALRAEIGLRSNASRSQPRKLPPELVRELKLKRELEKNWKSLNSASPQGQSEGVKAAEQLFLEQKEHVSSLLLLHRQKKRESIKERCSGQSSESRRNFWSHVSPSGKQKTDLSAVVDPVSGVVKCDADEIRLEVEKHLTSVFQGSYEHIRDEPRIGKPSDHSYTQIPPASFPGTHPDHPYSRNPSPSLHNRDSSCSIGSNPSGWLNSSFKVAEVTKMIAGLKNKKAKGWDSIPNEAIKCLPEEMVVMITQLFNMIKSSGVLPKGWNRGRVTLVHKYGLRELLGNYRPITVIISLSSLYSKVLNERLMMVVEEHKLLGEVQNGFRKERCGADNNFILDTVLWKARATLKKVHLSFVDVSKAYDSINRDLLWTKHRN